MPWPASPTTRQRFILDCSCCFQIPKVPWLSTIPAHAQHLEQSRLHQSPSAALPFHFPSILPNTSPLQRFAPFRYRRSYHRPRCTPRESTTCVGIASPRVRRLALVWQPHLRIWRNLSGRQSSNSATNYSLDPDRPRYKPPQSTPTPLDNIVSSHPNRQSPAGRHHAHFPIPNATFVPYYLLFLSPMMMILMMMILLVAARILVSQRDYRFPPILPMYLPPRVPKVRHDRWRRPNQERRAIWKWTAQSLFGAGGGQGNHRYSSILLGMMMMLVVLATFRQSVSSCVGSIV
mmetsp:Transcript_49516/g.75354  ORF Transcript_49516/g.75354 Transcript_49516/m.75354 type:complete len:290 (-) Transcript_49516:288-1157(-)